MSSVGDRDRRARVLPSQPAGPLVHGGVRESEKGHQGSKRGSGLAIGLLSCALLMAACDHGGLETSRSVGDGVLAEQKRELIHHFPRYTISMPKVTLDTAGARNFRLSDVPRASYDFHLAVETRSGVPATQAAWSSLWDRLQEAGIVVRVSIARRASSDEGGISEFEAPLAGGWEPAFGGVLPTEAGFAASQLERLDLEGDVVVAIELYGSMSELLEGVALTPVLLGGGERK